MLQIFKSKEKNSRNEGFQFWGQDNQPKECYSKSFTDQKLEYVHNNPVEAGLVDKAENMCTVAPGIILMVRTLPADT